MVHVFEYILIKLNISIILIFLVNEKYIHMVYLSLYIMYTFYGSVKLSSDLD